MKIVDLKLSFEQVSLIKEHVGNCTLDVTDVVSSIHAALNECTTQSNADINIFNKRLDDCFTLGKSFRCALNENEEFISQIFSHGFSLGPGEFRDIPGPESHMFGQGLLGKKYE